MEIYTTARHIAQWHVKYLMKLSGALKPARRQQNAPLHVLDYSTVAIGVGTDPEGRANNKPTS